VLGEPLPVDLRDIVVGGILEAVVMFVQIGQVNVVIEQRGVSAVAAADVEHCPAAPAAHLVEKQVEHGRAMGWNFIVERAERSVIGTGICLVVDIVEIGFGLVVIDVT
jgi:hypothetical protein